MDTVSVEQQQVTRRGFIPFELGKTRQKQIGDGIIFLILTLGGIFMALPFLWMVSSSLKPLSEIYVFPPEVLPKTILWTNYAEIFRRLPFHLFFRNTTSDTPPEARIRHRCIPGVSQPDDELACVPL